MSFEIRQGDALDLARAQGDATIDCIVTSPPYWGLRDYGVNGQLGLEPHPAQYLEALWAHADEWYRLLKPTGTLWVNLGDTYGRAGGDHNRETPTNGTGQRTVAEVGGYASNRNECPAGDPWLRPKQLLLIPSRFAIGMQEGRPRPRIIQKDTDAAWLAGVVDSDGCMGIRRGYARNGTPVFTPYLDVTQVDTGVLQHIVEITGMASVRPQREHRAGNRKPRSTWRLDGPQAVEVAADIFPWLIIKARQAKLIYALNNRKGIRAGRGKPLPADEVAYREQLWILCKQANQRTLDDTLDEWAGPEPRRIGGGWILRNDVIWHKPNAMPSSAEDRFTCAYEHVFYFVKQERAFFNMEDSLEAYSTPLNRFGGEDMESESEWDEGTGQSTLRSRPARPNDSGRHPRDVFTIPTTGSHIPHYAMMPQELARKLVVAGTPPKVCGECGKPWEREVDATSDWERRKAAGEPIRHGLARAAASGAGGFVMPTRTPGPWYPACTCDAGTVPGLVLDPFCGAGTTGIVARRLGFRFLGFELDAEMVAVARSRIARAHVKEKRPPKQPDPQVQGSLL